MKELTYFVSCVIAAVWMIDNISAFSDLDQLNRRATYLEGKVGSHVVLNCPLDFPSDSPIPYVLRWLKDVS